MYVIAYDFGTTGVKTCLFSIGEKVKMVTSEYGEYGLYNLDNGGAEQDTEEWWDAMCTTTRRLFKKIDIKPEEISGITFCSQMQGIVLVDDKGNALRRPMSYMDQRAVLEMKESMGHGLVISGANVRKLLKSLIITHAAPTSVKDPIWKYKWVQKNEPEVFSRLYKWLDVKEYLICRCTGQFVMTKDSAFATFLYDTRPGRVGWSKTLCEMYGVDPKHLPKVIDSTDQAGVLTEKAAKELGLKPGIPVYGGDGDATFFGKIIAGGYPGAGGVGGKKEYVQLMAAGLATGKRRAYVGGTLAANPLSCLAGYTAIREIERTNACVIAGRMGERLCDGLKELIDRYGLPFVAYNQGSIVHLECTGAMSFDFSSMSFIKSAIGILKHKDMIYERKNSMERMGAAYMANGIITLAGSRLYTSLADTPEIIDEALNRFEEVFKHVKKTNKGLVK